jgi:hypothetical protein
VGNVRQVLEAVHTPHHQKAKTTAEKVSVSTGSHHNTFSKMHFPIHCTKNADKGLHEDYWLIHTAENNPEFLWNITAYNKIWCFLHDPQSKQSSMQKLLSLLTATSSGSIMPQVHS